MFIFICAQLPVLAVSVLSVLGMLAALGLMIPVILAVSAFSRCVGVIRAVLGFGGLCRVEISVLTCLRRVCPAPLNIYIYTYIYTHIYVYM